MAFCHTRWCCAEAGFHSFGPTMPAVLTRGGATFQSVTFSANKVPEGTVALPLVYAAPNATVALQTCRFDQNDGRDDLGQASVDDVVRTLLQ